MTIDTETAKFFNTSFLPTNNMPGSPYPTPDSRESLANTWNKVHPLLEPKIDPVIKAPALLLEAADTLKERATQRDAAAQGERSMKRTVEAFNALTGKSLTEAEGWEFMVLLKLVRGRQGAFRKDDYVDGAAYCALLGECESKAVKQ